MMPVDCPLEATLQDYGQAKHPPSVHPKRNTTSKEKDVIPYWIPEIKILGISSCSMYGMYNWAENLSTPTAPKDYSYCSKNLPLMHHKLPLLHQKNTQTAPKNYP
jgi:hypothetical protein